MPGIVINTCIYGEMINRFKLLVIGSCTGLCISQLAYAVSISRAIDEGMECFRIETDSATYYYQIEAGGFSSILDKDGNDWLGYRKSEAESYPASAASDFRGLPNMVYQSADGGAGHPGFDKCISIQIDKRTIRTFSKSGKWQWSWKFTDTDATLTVEEVDPEHVYWFLYEGPIGGTFDPDNQYWGNNKQGPIKEFADYYKGKEIYDQWDWAYFGSHALDRILLIEHLTPDGLPDTMGYLGNSEKGLESDDGMVVFGFGRYRNAKPQMSRADNQFRIRFMEKRIQNSADHQMITKTIN